MDYFKAKINKNLRNLGAVFIIISGYAFFFLFLANPSIDFIKPTNILFLVFMNSVVLLSVGITLINIGKSISE